MATASSVDEVALREKQLEGNQCRVSAAMAAEQSRAERLRQRSNLSMVLAPPVVSRSSQSVPHLIPDHGNT